MSTSFERSEELKNYNYDIKHAFSNYIFLLFSNIALSVFSFINTFLVTRWLGSEGYGKLSLFLAVSSGIQILGINWTVDSLARFGCEELIQTDKINKAFWARSFLLILNLIPICVGCYIFRHFISGYIGLGERSYWFIIVYVVGMSIFSHFRYSLQAAKRIKQIGLFQLIEKAIIALGICVIVGLAWMRINNVICVFILAIYASTLAFLAMINIRILLPIKLHRSALRNQLIFSLPLLLGYYSGFLGVSYLDIIVLKHFLPLTEVGVYNLANQLSGLIVQVPGVAVPVFLSMLTTLYVNDRKDLIGAYLTRVLPDLAFLWSVAVCIIMFCGQYMIPIIFGDGFRPSVKPFCILLIAGVLSGTAFLGYSSMFSVCKMTLSRSLIVTVSATANFVGDVLLIPLFGITGCAVATIFNYGTSAMLTILVIDHHLNISNRKIFFSITPVVTAFMFVVYFKQLFLGIIVLLIHCYFLIRLLRLLDYKNLTILDYINMPSSLRWLVMKIYHG